MHISVFFGLIIALFTQPALAARKTCEDSFVKVATQEVNASRFLLSNVEIEGRRVFYEFLPPENGKPTAVIFNGLFVPNFNFNGFKAEFEAKSRGEGLLLFSYSSGVESLLVSSLVDGNVKSNLAPRTIEDFAAEGLAAVRAAGVKGSVFPVGYSYGSSTAGSFARTVSSNGDAYIVDGLIYIGPLVTAGEHNPGLLAGKSAMNSMTAFNPFGRLWAEVLIASTERTMATQFVDGMFTGDMKIPAGITRENIIDGVVVQMAAARDFDLRTTEHPPVRTHFIVGEKENPGRLQLQIEVQKAIETQAVARGDAPGEFTVISGAEHTAILTHPREAVREILKIMREKSGLTGERSARARARRVSEN